MKLATKTKTAVVKTPTTRKIVTSAYQHYQLIGDVLYNKTYKRITEPLHKRFGYFESYYLSVTNQPIQLPSMYSKIATLFTTNNATKKKYNALNFLNATDFMDDANVRTIIIMFIYMYYAFYYLIAPNMNKFHRNINNRFSRINIEAFSYVTSSADSVKELYEDIITDLITQLCGEGNSEVLYKYHYTELDKEVYLLKELERKLLEKGVKKPFDMKNINTRKTMIEVLNEKFSIYKDDMLQSDGVLFTHEAQAIAHEYLTKIELINEHESRMYLFKMFEQTILKLTRPFVVNEQAQAKPWSDVLKRGNLNVLLNLNELNDLMLARLNERKSETFVQLFEYIQDHVQEAPDQRPQQ
jgi:hypothetical protein